MPFSQIISPSPSPTESKRLFYTSGPLLLSHIQGYFLINHNNRKNKKTNYRKIKYNMYLYKIYTHAYMLSWISHV